MSSSLTKMQWILASIGLLGASAFGVGAASGADGQDGKSLAQQIFEIMIQVPGANQAYRTAQQKGLCAGERCRPLKMRRTSPKLLIFREARSP